MLLTEGTPDGLSLDFIQEVGKKVKKSLCLLRTIHCFHLHFIFHLDSSNVFILFYVAGKQQDILLHIDLFHKCTNPDEDS